VPDVVRPPRSRTGWSASRHFDVPTEQGSRGPAVMRPPVAAGPTLVACPTGARLQIPGGASTLSCAPGFVELLPPIAGGLLTVVAVFAVVAVVFEGLWVIAAIVAAIATLALLWLYIREECLG
jgi:hypothetical protein